MWFSVFVFAIDNNKYLHNEESNLSKVRTYFHFVVYLILL